MITIMIMIIITIVITQKEKKKKEKKRQLRLGITNNKKLANCLAPIYKFPDLEHPISSRLITFRLREVPLNFTVIQASDCVITK